jgi:hypothetical protein
MEIYENLSLGDMEGEVWKDIKGYEGLYQVSNMGRVKSLEKKCKCCGGGVRTIRCKILKQTPYSNGYLMLSLSKENEIKKFMVHRLVAIMFIENTENKPTVDHKNTIITDNRVDNLRWATQKENLSNEITRKRFKEIQSETGRKNVKFAQKSHEKKVKCVNTGEVFESLTKAGKHYGINSDGISSCCKGKKDYFGKLNGQKLQWEYID